METPENNKEDFEELKRMNSYLIQLAGAGLMAERQKHEFSRMLRLLTSSIEKMKVISENADTNMQEEIQKLENATILLKDTFLKYDKAIVVKSAGFEKELDLMKIVNDSLKLLETDLKKNEVNVSIIGDSFKVKMPEGALLQVIVNLISNAVDELKNHSENDKKIKIILEPSQRKLFLSDNGKGIPSKCSDKIFQLFFTTKENQGGKGIGLHLVKELLTKRGYSIFLLNASDSLNLLSGASFQIQF